MLRAKLVCFSVFEKMYIDKNFWTFVSFEKVVTRTHLHIAKMRENGKVTISEVSVIFCTSFQA